MLDKLFDIGAVENTQDMCVDKYCKLLVSHQIDVASAMVGLKREVEEVNLNSLLVSAKLLSGGIINDETNALREKLITRVDNNPHRGYTYENLLNAIGSDTHLEDSLTKDPTRQNLGEKLVLEYLQELFGASNVKKLSGYYFRDATLEKSTGRLGVSSKSVDFAVVAGDTAYMIAQKFTTGSGGSQDAAADEMKQYMKDASNTQASYVHLGSLKNVVPVVIVDGSYYNKTMFDDMKDSAINTGVIVCGLLDLIKYAK